MSEEQKTQQPQPQQSPPKPRLQITFSPSATEKISVLKTQIGIPNELDLVSKGVAILTVLNEYKDADGFVRFLDKQNRVQKFKI